MGKKILAASLVLVMVFSFTACGDDYPPVEEIVDNSTQAMADISTCTFDLDMSMGMDIDSEAEGEAMEMTMEMDGSGALDAENMQMRMDVTANVAVAGGEEVDTDEEITMDMNMEMYLVDNTLYMMMDIPLTEPSWMKTEMPAESWEQMNQIGPQVELLETAEVEVIGSETVNGIDCYVLEITPDMEQLWELASQQALLTGEMPDIDEELIEEMIQAHSLKQWVAKDTWFIMKIEMEMTMELTPEAMGYLDEEGEVIMDISITMLVYDYNQPVSIELPAEAEEATEMPLDSFPFGY